MQTFSPHLAGIFALVCLAPTMAAEPNQVDLRAEFSKGSVTGFLDRYYTPEHRQAVAAMLAEMMASDPDPSKRLRAFGAWDAIQKLSKKEMIGAIREATGQNTSESFSSDVNDAILICGDEGVEFLPRLLFFEQAGCKSNVAWTLCKTLSNAKILELVDHDDPDVRGLAFSVIRFLSEEHDSLLQKIRGLTYGGTPEHRAEAMALLAEAQSKVPIRARLLELANDPDGRIGGCAVRCLSLKQPVERELLLTWVNHKSAEVREAAIRELARENPLANEVRAALIERIKEDEVPWVAHTAVFALAQARERAALAVPDIRRRLIECADDASRQQLIEALARIGPTAKEAAGDLRDLREHCPPYTQLAIAKALWKIDPRPEDTVGIVRAIMERPEVRHQYGGYNLVILTQEVAIAAGKRGHPLVPVLVDYLEYATAAPPGKAWQPGWSLAVESTVRTLQAIGPAAHEARGVLRKVAANNDLSPIARQAAADTLKKLEAEPR